MLKRVNIIFVGILILFGCATKQDIVQNGAGIRYAGFSSEIGNFEGFKAAMLLPLSGKAAVQGEGLQNAALLAINEINNPNMVIEFFDTEGTPEGALKAARGAIAKDSSVLVGPLMSEEVEAITDLAKSEKIPVVSFSTSPRVLQRGVYSIGLLGSEQISAIVNFAAKKGRKNFAILVPDNNYGMGLAKAAYYATKSNNVSLVKIGVYPPDSIDFTELLSDFTDYKHRANKAESLKKAAARRYENGDEKAAEELRRLKNVDSIGGVDFDAIILPEGGSKLKFASSMLGYYDVFSPEVMFLGTATWDNTNLTKETTLYGAYYPALSKQHAKYMSDKYFELYGKYPESLYSMAYDAVAMVSELSKSEIPVDKRLVDDRGFSGINGRFRLFEDGSNQHNIKIFEITAKGQKEVEDSFASSAETENVNYDFYVSKMPQVYGKDTEEVLRYILSDY